jgi:hypothetical protein
MYCGVTRGTTHWGNDATDNGGIRDAEPPVEEVGRTSSPPPSNKLKLKVDRLYGLTVSRCRSPVIQVEEQELGDEKIVKSELLYSAWGQRTPPLRVK